MPGLDSGFSGAAFELNALALSAERDTAVHRLHPSVKLATTLVYVIAVISFGRYEIGALMPFFFYPAVLIPLSETPYKAVFKRLLPALPFPLFGGLSNVFFDRVPMFFVGDVAITGGAVSFLSIMIKTVLSVSAILLLVSTTGIEELSAQFLSLGVPDGLVLQFVLTYRYLSVLVNEARTMYASYILRSVDARGIRMKDMGAFVGVMLLHSIDRAERVYAAMKCRGFSGAYPVSRRRRPNALDLIYLFAVCGAIVAPLCFR
ncbi:MAG: cobalt ECF transporter T component CbiQ [Synergistaceae bacterium]|jgi:cobalt/nickel transport system permease protein|nr:cobalt ECF transporter T component CbiQ [Synergistaceae bacterium]